MTKKFKNFIIKSRYSVVILTLFIVYQIALTQALENIGIFSAILMAICLSLFIGIIDGLSDDQLSNSLKKDINFNNWMLILLSFVFILVGQLFINILINTTASSTNESINSFIIATDNSGNNSDKIIWKLSLVLIIGVISPIIEELLFRFLVFLGSTHKVGLNKNNILPMVISSLLFMFIHVINATPSDIIVYLMMGFIYSFLYMKTETIMAPIIAHILNNTVVAIMLINTI